MNIQSQLSTRDELELGPSLNSADFGSRLASTKHEARNALTVIRVGLESCQRTQLSPAVNNKITIIVSEVDRLNYLLNELLAQNNHSKLQFELLSRLESGTSLPLCLTTNPPQR
ncbi:hypothetical protein IQ260_09105 [Leptolyngbya cf. ectocarpi LEGE 11479]|uniref:histidine kinase n=1 Tax=Leptolyngbya cf. ectocarpi LEGE 11479 TaxID=1828722 RepID=A0A928ZTR2_LEPEC|nr:histidine kinase dimerization/phospho-acceptor domain-containing protein [Leptolyngbya ectocarpi]MBE9066809.1 hypothetical protein [Leptolyngbya cf. ectocarpi LEGE 11479]